MKAEIRWSLVRLFGSVISAVAASAAVWGLVGALLAAGLFYGTWIYYVAVMHLASLRDQYRTRGEKPPFLFRWFAWPAAYLFLVVDVLFNAVYGTILFLEVPREWLFTDRVSRWNDSDDWRGDLARLICRQLLDPADPTRRHCS